MRFISHQPSALLISSRAFNVYRPKSHGGSVCCFAVVERAENEGGQGGQGRFMTNGPGGKIYHTARTSNGVIVVAKSRKDSLVPTNVHCEALELLEKQEK